MFKNMKETIKERYRNIPRSLKVKPNTDNLKEFKQSPSLSNAVNPKDNPPQSPHLSKTSAKSSPKFGLFPEQPPIDQTSQHFQSNDSKLFGRIANYLTQLPLDNNLNIFAKSYGFIVMGAIAENLLRSTSRAELLGKSYGFSNFNQLLHQTSAIRNLIADYFIRIKDLHYILDCNFELEAFSVLESENEQQTGGRLTGWKNRADVIELTRKHSVKMIDQFAYILDALRKIHEIVAYDPEISSDASAFAIAMLYVIAGTCARDLLLKKLISDEKLIEHFTILKLTRDEFAHYDIVGKNTAVFKNSIKDNNNLVAELIIKLESQIPAIEACVDQEYKTQIIPLTVVVTNKFPTEKNNTEIKPNENQLVACTSP